MFYSPSTEASSDKQNKIKQDLVKNALSALQHAEETESDYKSDTDEENTLY